VTRRTLGAMRSPTILRPVLVAFLALLGLALPTTTLAHPLGNFTINHYAALRVGDDRISLDVVIDYAEIPAFQERIRIDSDGDGEVTNEETDLARISECMALTQSLELRGGGTPVDLRLTAAGLAFPAGAGGVPTMRVVCEYVGLPDGSLTDGRTVTFEDLSHVERIGWREILVLGDGVTIAGAPGALTPAGADVSGRLTAYPKDLLAQPLDVRSVAFVVEGGGPALAAYLAPDAAALDAGAADGGPAVGPAVGAGPAIVPGGVGAEIPDLFRTADLTLFVGIASIVLAMALGAGHALTPGHGKTLMAAYLVGTRGTVRHAAGLGLAVTVSHTLGILALALLITGAESLLPADVVVRTIPVIAAAAFVAIGATMLSAEVRRRRRVSRFERIAHFHDGAPGHDHHGARDHDHGHDDADDTVHAHDQVVAVPAVAGRHSHGGVSHSHLPADDPKLSWRSLFALGLAGGIIPSTNALIILLGTIVAGRTAFGIILVIAFGLGMAVVLSGVGVLMIVARRRMELLPSATALGRAARQAPLLASVAVLGIGLWLTAQALSGATVY